MFISSFTNIANDYSDNSSNLGDCCQCSISTFSNKNRSCGKRLEKGWVGRTVVSSSGGGKEWDLLPIHHIDGLLDHLKV